MLALALIASCQWFGSQPTCNTTIDWVNFLQVGSVQYVAGPASHAAAITESELGPELARVKFKVDGNVCDPNYHVKDGDAAFLEPGTSAACDRIAQGIKSGKLTAGETAKLENQQKGINQQVAADRKANGGKLTTAEKKQVNHEQNQASKNIHHKKHNEATQSSAKKP